MIKEDFKKHGFKLTKEEGNTLEFESDFDYNKKHIDPEIADTHPIFDEDSKGMKSKVIIHSICGRCNAPVIDGECSVCHRKINLVSLKGHIPTIKELEAMR